LGFFGLNKKIKGKKQGNRPVKNKI